VKEPPSPQTHPHNASRTLRSFTVGSRITQCVAMLFATRIPPRLIRSTEPAGRNAPSLQTRRANAALTDSSDSAAALPRRLWKRSPQHKFQERVASAKGEDARTVRLRSPP